MAAPPSATPPADTDSGLSEGELGDLRQSLGDNARLFRVTVAFDEHNLMNTVGGVQVFAALKGVGQIVSTQPEFEQLYEDRFFPVVIYHVGSVEDAAHISDVTSNVGVVEMSMEGAPLRTAEHPAVAQVPQAAEVAQDDDEPLAKPPVGASEQGYGRAECGRSVRQGAQGVTRIVIARGQPADRRVAESRQRGCHQQGLDEPDRFDHRGRCQQD